MPPLLPLSHFIGTGYVKNLLAPTASVYPGLRTVPSLSLSAPKKEKKETKVLFASFFFRSCMGLRVAESACSNRRPRTASRLLIRICATNGQGISLRNFARRRRFSRIEFFRRNLDFSLRPSIRILKICRLNSEPSI